MPMLQGVQLSLRTSFMQCRPATRLPHVPKTNHAALFKRLSLLRHQSTFSHPHQHPPRRWFMICALPLAGGFVFYQMSRRKAINAHDVFTSPALIPCHAQPSNEYTCTESETLILSPNEESLVSRIIRFKDTLWESVFTATRFIHLFFIFIPVIFSSPMLLVGTPEKRYDGDRWGAVWWYKRLVAAMARAGPTFIKLSQWAASRTDLFPLQLTQRLGTLHSQGKPHSIRHTRRVIERVFQRKFEDVFEEFDETPVGVGAIAQVHRATLRPGIIPPSYLHPKRRGRKSSPTALPSVIPPDQPPSVPSAAVAIKILHPRVTKTISRDITIMRFFASLVSIFPGMQWISIPEEVDVFAVMMAAQLDLRHEAQNLLTFEKNFATRQTPVTFPRPLMSFTSKDVLVEEYQDALPLEDFLHNGGGPYDFQIAQMGLDSFLNMLLLDNFVHADLHPGNIMIKFYKPSTTDLLKSIMTSLFHKSSQTPPLPGGTQENDTIVGRLRGLRNSHEEWSSELQALSNEGYQPEVVFLDAGLTTTLSDVNRRNFLDLFRAIAEFDGYRAGKLMVERCRTPELTIDPETFALKMQHIVLSVKRKTFSLGRIKISDILGEVLKAVRDHHVKMEGDFINTVLAVLLLEGIGRQLDPELDLFKSALPILRRLGRQMTMQETMESAADLPKSNLGAYLKLWVWLEARSLAAAAFDNLDDLVRYDWLVPNV